MLTITEATDTIQIFHLLSDSLIYLGFGCKNQLLDHFLGLDLVEFPQTLVDLLRAQAARLEIPGSKTKASVSSKQRQ